MLLRRYIVAFIAQMQQLSAPVYTQLRENTRFTPSGDGAFFPVHIDGNESGGGWRATDDNTLPTAGNERIKQARVRPKKLTNASYLRQLRYTNAYNCWNTFT